MTTDTFHRSACSWLLVNEKVLEVIKVDSKKVPVINCEKYGCVSIDKIYVEAKQ